MILLQHPLCYPTSNPVPDPTVTSDLTSVVIDGEIAVEKLGKQPASLRICARRTPVWHFLKPLTHLRGSQQLGITLEAASRVQSFDFAR